MHSRTVRGFSLVLLLGVLCSCPPLGGTDGGPAGDSGRADAGAHDLGVDAAPAADGASGIKTTLLRVQGTQIVDANKQPVTLKCVALAGWLDHTLYIHASYWGLLAFSPNELRLGLQKVVGQQEAGSFWRSFEDNFITEQDFIRMAKLGFNCARVPLFYRRIVPTSWSGSGPVKLVEETMKRLDRAVSWGEKHGVWIIPDLHSAPGGQNPVASVSGVPSKDLKARLWEGSAAKKNQDWTVEIWRALAARYKGRASVGAYDLLNEPAMPLGMSAAPLVSLQQRALAAIRAVDPKHIVIFSGPKFAQDLTVFKPSSEANLVYQFHAYTILNAAWSSPETYAGFKQHLKDRTRLGRPLWLGEFGENTRKWQARVTKLMMANKIGWSLWPWKRVSNSFDPKKDDSPAIQTMNRWVNGNSLHKDNWGAVVNDIVWGKTVDASRARRAMKHVLSWIKLANCKEDAALASEVTSGKPAP